MDSMLRSDSHEVPLAGIVAHEIRRPLSSIVFTAGWVLRLCDPREIRRALHQIRDLARSGGEVVTQITRVVSGAHGKRTFLDINALVREAVDSFEHDSTSSCGIRIEREEPLAPVSANAVAIRQVVINLIENATAAAGPIGHVIVSTCGGCDYVEVAIEDDGAGIAAENKDRVFEPYFTCKQDTGGTGLGLTLCRHLAAAHGGSIDFSSEVGRGSRFCLRLPVAAEIHRSHIGSERPALAAQ